MNTEKKYFSMLLCELLINSLLCLLLIKKIIQHFLVLLFVDTNIAYNLKKNNYRIQYSYMRNNIFFIIHLTTNIW